MEMDSFYPVLNPVIVHGEWQTKISHVACGKTHMVALCETGEMYSWGDNRCAQLGLLLSKPIFPSPSSSSSSSASSSTSSSSYGMHSTAVRGGSGRSRISGPGSGISSGSFNTDQNQPDLPSSSPAINGNGIDRGVDGIKGTVLPYYQSDGTASQSAYLSPHLSLSITSELSSVMACRPVLIDCMKSVKITSIVCGAYHTLCLSDQGLVYSWGRVSNGRLGQFPDRACTPDNAVGRPALVRCSWVVEDFDLFPSSPSIKAYSAMTLEEELSVTLEDFYSYSTKSQSQGRGGGSDLYDIDVQSRHDDDDVTDSRRGTPSPIPSEVDIEGVERIGGEVGRGSGSGRHLSTHATEEYKSKTRSSSRDKSSRQNVRPKYVQRIQHTPEPESSVPPTPRPSSPSSLHRVVCIAAGFSHSVAVTAGGGVFTWGNGTHGRLGHGSHADEFLPRQVSLALTPHALSY